MKIKASIMNHSNSSDRKFLIALLCEFLFSFCSIAQDIPLPEHPRPDFMREQWINLNGLWNFRFDAKNEGEQEKWYLSSVGFNQKILVPFPWGSPLSGIENKADVAWYSRTINIPKGWAGKRVFIVVGASDWTTTAWLDGQKLGSFQGGYTPFEFELTSYINPGKEQLLVIKVDDTPHSFKLEGKQGYGPAKGIWQTTYLEARGIEYIKILHFTPDIDASIVTIKVVMNQPAPQDLILKIILRNSDQSKPENIQTIRKGSDELIFKVPIESEHLWNLDDPFLYEAEAVLIQNESPVDKVQSYFGMRKISVVPLPGLNYLYIALNGKPVYLKLTLDQSYNPMGFYTFPSDEFMKQEILRSKRIGLNGNRIHIKLEVPRKLYWADRLGLLIMADVPNSWGEPDSYMRKEWETAMRGMIERDYNHPSIFQWVLFNETWGLSTKKPDNQNEYLPETQSWIEKMYLEAKKLDITRLVEDNSACNYDHVATDVNSWHMYLPGYEWKKCLDDVEKNTIPGSTWNFVKGRQQANQPLLNSECGNVWGYKGSTGDVDWSWDYHRMMNEMRAHPKICGWLYTEHHDVINEWNGYYRYDRSNKYTGLDALVAGMCINDLHSDIYLSIPGPVCRSVKLSENVEVPLFLSCFTPRDLGHSLEIKSELYGWDNLGRMQHWNSNSFRVPFTPWMARPIDSLNIQMPSVSGLAILALIIQDEAGNILHHNFTCFRVGNPVSLRKETLYDKDQTLLLVRFSPATFSSAKWSLKQWSIFDGLKVNGAGYGYFEYHVPWPAGLAAKQVDETSLVLEVSAKQLFGKDRSDAEKMSGDYMLGKGTIDPSRNPNAYPMTDDNKYPSMVRIRVNGESVATCFLEDDPADHRGILSWFAQPENKKLHEAGSYGYLVKAIIPNSVMAKSEGKEIVIRLEVDESLPGGLAIYGEQFGRYPVDPTIVFVLKK